MYKTNFHIGPGFSVLTLLYLDLRGWMNQILYSSCAHSTTKTSLKDFTISQSTVLHGECACWELSILSLLEARPTAEVLKHHQLGTPLIASKQSPEECLDVSSVISLTSLIDESNFWLARLRYVIPVRRYLPIPMFLPNAPRNPATVSGTRYLY
jgi:hypothetical protein